ncbi:MAG: heat-shock protein Hsp20 [Verrucomicrobia bacterium]|nr:MAG: heat-shock protein Hsp20 [Verrucomicrobiota bacterium]
MNELTKWNPFGVRDWDPFRELEDFQNRLSSFFGSVPSRRGREGGATFTEWSPAVDITEDTKEFLVKAELPEIKKEDVHVTVEGGVLTIRGERKYEKEEKGKRMHRVERSYGAFTRSFSLPEGADAARVRADFKDGMLYVHLPKSDKARPKEIEVKVE